MHEAVTLGPAADQQAAAQFLTTKKPLGTGSRSFLARGALVDESGRQQLDHVGLRGFVAVALLSENVQGDLREPLAHPGPFLVRFLFALFIQRRYFAGELDVLGLLALAQQHVNAFVVQIDALFGEAFAVPMHDGDHGQEKRINCQRPNAVALFDSLSEAVEFFLGVASFRPHVVGRDPAELAARYSRLTAANPLAGRTGDPEEGLQRLRERGWLIGSPAEIVDSLGRLAEAGVGRVMLHHLDKEDFEALDLLARGIEAALETGSSSPGGER